MATVQHWLTGVSASFNTAADWTGSVVVVPTSTSDAIIDAPGTYTVTSSQSNTVNSLSLVPTATLAITGTNTVFDILNGTSGSIPEANAGTISVAGANTFETGGNFVNFGTITLNSSGTVASTSAHFEIAGNVSLSGGGALTLSANAFNFIISNGSAQTFTNVDNTISGAGTIGDAYLTLVNQQSGLIDANQTVALTIATGANAVVNTGTLEDTGAGGLLIHGTAHTVTVNNATTSDPVGGVIEAVGATAHVDLKAADIVGGTLITTGGGKIDTVAGDFYSELDGFSGVGGSLTNAGTFVVTSDSGLTIQGDIHNIGTINLAGSGTSATSPTELEITGNGATLNGGGSLVLSSNAYNYIITNGATATLTNQANTISGAGTIGNGSDLTLINDAVINANGTVALILATGSNNAITNNGLIETTGTAGLQISSPVTNTDGTLLALGTGGLVLSNTVTGGTISTQNTGSNIDLQGGTISGANVAILTGAKLDTVAASTGAVEDSNVDNAGTIAVVASSTLTADGTITNTGSISLAGASAAAVSTLSLDDNLTLQGGGLVTLSSSAYNTISASAAATLNNVNNTISGAGTIGNGTANTNLTLENDAGGVINANGTVALILNTSTNDIGNAGLLESTGAGGLTISSYLDNTGTVTAASTVLLIISDGLDNTGLVQTTGTGGLELNDNATTNGGAIDAIGAGNLLILNSTIDNTGGTIGSLSSSTSVHSLITLQNSTIDGGTVVTLAGDTVTNATGTVNEIKDATINNAGSIAVSNGSTLWLNADTVDNHGTISSNASTLGTKSLDRR